MFHKSRVFVLIPMMMLLFAACGNVTQTQQPEATQTVKVSPVVTSEPSTTVGQSPVVTPSSTNIHMDWLTYTNATYGFEIMYPKTYQALTDKDSLYGWPKAIAVLYNGGQAYDIVIEAWDTEEEYKGKYGQGNYTFIVNKIRDKYITVTSFTDDADNKGIIETFKITN
jgi:hypothetical protein